MGAESPAVNLGIPPFISRKLLELECW